MNVLRKLQDALKKPAGMILAIVLVVFIVFAALSYLFVFNSHSSTPKPVTHSKPTPTPRPTPIPSATPSPTPTPIVLPTQSPAQTLGIDAGSSQTVYKDISWLRLGYPTCGWGNLRGAELKNVIQSFHAKGVRILLTVCQQGGDALFDTNILNDAAQGNPDAVQCGNEEMKQDASVSFLYVPPEKFARFYDLCEHAVHSVRSDIPVILGSLDPHVANADYQQLANQAYYLDQMQNAMNSNVHPGGNWDWHNQKVGLIDSWHNGYAGANNLRDLFAFWAQQFHVDPYSGELGKHLWVIEGTGCFKGCGVPFDAYDIAVAHILALVTDVQTTKQAKVPFFYFSGKDFFDQGVDWPIGVLDANGNAKPIRQDLSMGARVLTLSCPGGNVNVSEQLQLLAKMYSGCNLPSNYVSVLTS